MMTKSLTYKQVDFVTTSYIFEPKDFNYKWFPEVGNTFRMRCSILNLSTGKFEPMTEYGTVTITELARPKNLVGEGFARIGIFRSSDEVAREIGIIFRGSIEVWERIKRNCKAG